MDFFCVAFRGLGSHFFHNIRTGGSERFPTLILLAILANTFGNPVHAQEKLQVLQHHVRPAVTEGKAQLVGAMPADEQLSFSIVLPLRNEAELDRMLGTLYDPSSPSYRQFLSVPEFTEKFGPSAEDYAAVLAFAQASGFESIAPPGANRLVIPLRGTVEAINNAFHVQMSLYQHPTEDRTFFSPDREPSLVLGVSVAHVAGLNNYSVPKPMVSRGNQLSATDVTGSGPGGSYLASDMRAAYYGGTQLTGAGQAVGLVEFGGYYLSDVEQTFATAGQSFTVPIHNVLLDGAAAEPGWNEDDAEQVLDIVQAIGMAPGLSQVRVYVGTGPDDANVLNSMAAENIAKALSCSWNWIPDDPATDDVFFKEFAAQGQSFFVASGDEGAFDAQISPYFYPAEDAYVTAVGGTHLDTVAAGGAWSSETAWNAPPNGSGGGVSPDGIVLPTWQTGLATTANGGSTTLRNVPDVAMEGDFDNFNCDLGECGGGWAGTSFATPRWAAFTALVNQQAVEAGSAPKGGIGFLSPALYLLGAGSNSALDFHDIVIGSNLTDSQSTWYSAVAGYDLVTGWGSPTGQDLIDDLAGKQAPGFWLSASSPVVEMNPGTSGSTTLDIVDAGGFSGSVQLAITSTLPSGVTAKWAINPTSGSSVLTFTAASTAANTTTPVTITGTSGSTIETTQITLSVHTPSFSLSTLPGSVGVNPGGSVAAYVIIAPLYGFTGSVKLAVSGLPKGVTATLGTNPTTSVSVLTLKTSSTTPTGTSTVTITGTAGSLTEKTTLPLIVHVPTFTLVGPDTTNMGAGTSTQTYIYIAGEYGFSGNVNFSVAGLPKGVTASFSPNPTSNQTVLILTANGTTALGSSTLTVTGTSGSQKATTSLKLNILAPTFAIETSSPVTIGQGTTTTSQIWVVEEYGFNSAVNLAVSGLPTGVTASLSTNPATQGSVLTLTASSTAPLGSSTVTITGTSGTLKESTTFQLGVYVPTFSLNAGGAVSLGQGSSTSTNVFVTPEYGFTGLVNLAVSGLPAGVTASVTPPVNGTAQLTLMASTSAAVGNSALTITGTSGTQTVKTTLPLGVFAPTFTVAASGQVNLGIGSSATTFVNITPEYGFLGSVNLATSGLPSGVTASFSLNPTTGNSILTLAASNNVAAGSYTITLNGTSGTTTATTTFPLIVAPPGFTLSSVSPVDLGEGTTSAANINVIPANGFTGTVQLTIAGLPSGVTASFAPALVTGSSVLTLTAASTAVARTSTITIMGASGPLTAKTTFSLTVGAPTFTLAPLSSVTIGPGQTATTYASVIPSNGFTGSVSLSATHLPAGVTASFTPNPTNQNSTLTLTASNTAALGTSTVTMTGKWGSKTSSATFPLTVAAGSFTLAGPGLLQLAPGSTTTGNIYMYGSQGFASEVQLAVSGLPSGVTAAFSPNPASGSSTLALTASNSAAKGTTTLTVTGTSGKLTAKTTIQLQVQPAAFTLSGPSNLIVVPGTAVVGSVYIDPQFGFAGSVNLAVSGLPAGVTAAWSSNPSQQSSNLTLTASSTAALALTTVTITGTSGSLTATTTFQLAVQAPSIALGNSNVTLGQGTSTTTYVFVEPMNLTGSNVSLAVSGLPSGVSASFSPASTNSQSTLTLTASSTASLGQYNAVVTGTYGKLTSSVSLAVTVVVPGFTLWNPQGTAQVGQGNSVTSWIYVTPQNGFNGSVNLSAVGLPNGVTASFSPNPSTQSSQVTITASSTAALGEYNASIVGTSGTQTVTTPFNVSVYAPAFTLNAYQGATVNPGSSGQGFVTIQPLFGFTGSVSLSVTGLPSGVTGSFLPSPATDQSALMLSASNSATPGQYNLTVTGICGKQTATATMQLTIQANSFTLWSSGVTVGQGTSVSTYVNVNTQSPQGTLAYPVQLTASGLPSGVTASFSPNPTVSSSTLTLTASNSASVGEYAVTLAGVGGGQRATNQIPVTVSAPTFSLSGPNEVDIGQGSSSTTSVYFYAQLGFTGQVKFSVTGLPKGVVASFTPNPATNSTSMVLTTSASAPVGRYNVRLVGTSATQTVSSPFVLAIGKPSFTISDWGNLSVGQGASATSYASVNPSFGFNGAVSFSISGLPSGVTASFSPNPTTTESTLTLTATNNASPGVYLATISGASGETTVTTTLQFTVTAANFSLTSYSQPAVGQGSSTTGYLYVNSSSGFTGSIQLAASGLPNGVTAVFSPNPTTYESTFILTASSSVLPGQYSFTVNGVSGSLSASTTIQFTVYAPTFTIWAQAVTIGQGTTAVSYVSVNPQYGFTGNVQFAVSGLPSGVTASFTPNPAASSSTLTLTASSTASLGQYNITITGTCGNQTASATTSVAVYAPTFMLSSPGKVTVGQGASSQTYVWINPSYGFAGNVQFAISGLPNGVSASFSPNPATSNSNASLTLTASSTAALGEYNVIVTGTSGAQTVTTNLTIAVYAPAYTLNAYGVNMGQGTVTTTSVSVNSEYGFTGNVNFAVSGLPSGVTASFSPNPTSNNSTLTLTASSTAAVGQYPVTVMGTAGAQTASTTFALGVFVPTFTVNLYGNTTLTVGGTAQSSVYIYGQYGFSGNVQLAVLGLPSGVTASFSPNPATTSSTMTLTAGSSVKAGQYTLTIVGTSGSQRVASTVGLTIN